MPACADRNATATIIGKILVAGTAAAVMDSMPSSIFSRWLTIGRTALALSMYAIALASFLAYFKREATTGTRIAHPQGIAAGRDLFAAITTTKPQMMAALVAAILFKNGQSIIAVACDIYESGHRGLSYRFDVKWRSDVPASGRCVMRGV